MDQRRQRPWTLAVFAVAAANVMGVALLLAGFLLYKSSAQFIARAWPVQGSVIAYDQITYAGGAFVSPPVPMIGFNTPRGERYRFRSLAYTAWLDYRIGDKVTVLYDPRNPTAARVDGFWQLWSGAAASLLMGALFVVMPNVALALAVRRGVAVRRVRRPRPA